MNGRGPEIVSARTIAYEEEGNMLLLGHIPDQGALHGILMQIRDLGLTQISLSSRDNVEDAQQSAH